MMKKTIYTDLVWCSVLALVLATVLPSAALAEEVSFPDANLENVIRGELGIPEPTIITDTDMETMGSLYAGRESISNIQGLEYATNLTEVRLNENQIIDISAVSGLTNLEYLHLPVNHINNISAVSGLTSLYYLNLWDNRISDISAVSGLKNLKYLCLWDNQIETMDLSGSNLSSLRYFTIDGNPLKSVLLTDATLSQTTFNVLMDGGGGGGLFVGVAELDGVLSLDLSGVDFVGLGNLSSMYGMDDLEELLLARAINLDGSKLCLLTGELDSLNWLDITGAWDGFDMITQDCLNLWDAVEGNTLVIPEPASMVLLGLGALVLRRRKTV